MALASGSNRLTLQLSARPDCLEVRATAERGEARGEGALPSADLLEPLAQYEGDFPEAIVAPLGETLGKSLLPGDVGRLAADMLGDAIAAEAPVQLELRFDPDQVALAQFPWEMIRDRLGRYPVRDGLVDITRYITFPQPPAVFDAGLREQGILRVIAQPTGLAALDMGDLDLPRIETLVHATFAGLSHKLLVERKPLWGLHFDGHGALLQQCPDCDALCLPTASYCRACGRPLAGARTVGALAFEHDGKTDWIPATEFGSILYNARVRLAMLLACESARVGNRLVWSGLAPNLLLAGVPAVVGMQFAVYDDYATRFARSFYAALLKTNDPVDALRIARRADIREAWYSPVLYLRRQKRDGSVDQLRPLYQERQIDTAAPALAEAGVPFLVRLWIRRPETTPYSAAQLRAELDVPAHVALQEKQSSAEVKFEQIAGRALRRGAVTVKLATTGCEVLEPEIELFVDEHLDAPPAIFVVRATEVRRAALIFGVFQDGGQIASIVHHVGIIAPATLPVALDQTLTVYSHSVGLGEPPTVPPATWRIVCRQCGAQNRAEATFCTECGALLDWSSKAIPPSPTVPVPSPAEPEPPPPAPEPSTPSNRGHDRPNWSPGPEGVRRARFSDRWWATAVAAGGWASGGAVKGVAESRAPLSLVTELALGFAAGILVARALRESDAQLRLPHWALIAIGWALSWTALSFVSETILRSVLLAGITTDRVLAGSLARIGAGIISGAAGGLITAMVLQQARRSVGAGSVLKIVAGWSFAFVVAQILSPALSGALPPIAAGAIFWGLIALVGNALMLRFLDAAE